MPAPVIGGPDHQRNLTYDPLAPDKKGVDSVLDHRAKVMLSCLISEYDREVAHLKEIEEEAKFPTYAANLDGRITGLRAAIALFTGVYDIPTEGSGVKAWLPGLRELAR
jgi:hypothetical protein